MPRNKTFIYANPSIRVDNEPASHREGTRQIEWFDNSKDLWNRINWNTVHDRINAECHGTSKGAKIIETTLNVLDKYTGRKKNRQTVLQSGDEDFGITQDLIDQLSMVSMGSSGAAQSLLKYTLKPGMDKNIPGFSFENRMSEFIQRLMGDTTKGKKFNIKALETGANNVYVGESLMFYLGDHVKNTDLSNLSDYKRSKLVKEIMEQTNIDFNNLVSYIYEEVSREIDGAIQPDIAVVAYKVPQKADITVGEIPEEKTMQIEASYGKLAADFLRTISGAKISLKNSTSSSIKLGSTNDNTRLRGFVSEYVEKINKDFATICTFIFASKNSKDITVQKYLDWARILYELQGTGQRLQLDNKRQGEDLLVDYLVINRYKSDGSAGSAIVFNVKDLIANFPNANYYPPFRFDDKNADENGKNSGSVVVLNLGQAKKFVFST